MKCDEHEGQGMEADQDELMRRLRRLEWPAAPAVVKRRCWEDLSKKLELGDSVGERVPAKPRRNIGERYDYSRRTLAARSATEGTRLAKRAAWGRPARALSLA